MGNFEKLSVLVIGVIIVMILVVALYTWTDDPAAEERAQVNPGGGPGVVANTPRNTDVKDDSPWGAWDLPAPPVTPKPVKVIDDRPDEPGRAIQDKVDAVAEKPPVETPLEQPAERTYTVKPNDTLGGIALSEMGSTKYWKAIQVRNDVDPMKLRPDMTLIIPAIDGTAIAPNKSPTALAAGGLAKPGSAYTVRNGDTIQKISQSAYRTIERWTDIWFANMERIADPRTLRPGMTLEIPN